jgi:hypothetical protein
MIIGIQVQKQMDASIQFIFVSVTDVLFGKLCT